MPLRVHEYVFYKHHKSLTEPRKEREKKIDSVLIDSNVHMLFYENNYIEIIKNFMI